MSKIFCNLKHFLCLPKTTKRLPSIAIATRNYLLQQRVAPEGTTIRLLDKSKLKTSENTALEHAHNRRVEIEFQDLRGIDIILEEQDSDLQLESQ